MKKLKLLVFLFIGIAQTGLAQINIYTNTIWTNISVSQDVIIHPGATLTIQDGGLNMAQDKYIHVMDRGQLKGVNGFITSSSGGLWKGIYLDQTPNGSPAIAYGINFYNFTVERALVAISSAYGVTGSNPFLAGPAGAPEKHNRKIRAVYTIFQQNYADILVSNDIDGDLAIFESLTHSQIFLQFCQFKDNISNSGYYQWPVHMLSCKDIFVFNSEFTSDSSDILLHLRNTINSRFNDNYFKGNVAEGYLAFHGYNSNNFIEGNTFDLYNSGPQKVGIDIGTFSSSRSINVTVRDNIFQGTTIESNSWGIGSYANSLIDEKDNLNIQNNEFKNLKHGIYLGKLMVENVIEENEFTNCYQAIYFVKENPQVNIACNEFSDCIRDIMIAEEATLQSQNLGYDQANSFSPLIFLPSEPQYNIQNYGTADFYYDYKDYPPYIQPGVVNIVLNQVNTKIKCQSEQNDEDAVIRANNSVIDMKDQLTVYPNPNSGNFSIQTSREGVSEYFIINAAGGIIYSGQFKDRTEISLNEIPSGVYFLRVKNSEFETVEKLLIK